MDTNKFIERLVDGLIAAHSSHPGLHRVLLDEAPGSPDYRDENNRIEAEYLALFAEAIQRFGGRKTGARAGMVISDAIDGVIHNAARRARLGEPFVRAELTKLLAAYLHTSSS